jgi:thiol-disulfide isomerase/thioredoxin
MRINVLLLLLLAAGLGMAGSIVLSSLVDPQPQAAQIAPTERIYVAQSAIESGRVIGQEDMRLEAWHRDNVPPGAIRRMEDVHQHIANRAIRPGEPIVTSLLADARDLRANDQQTLVAQTTEPPVPQPTEPAKISSTEPPVPQPTETANTSSTEPAAGTAAAAPTEVTEVVKALTPVVADTKAGPNDEYLVMSVHTPEQVKVIKWRRSEGALLPDHPEGFQPEGVVADASRGGARFSMSDEGDSGVLRGSGRVSPERLARSQGAAAGFDVREFQGRPVVVVFGATSNAATREELIEMSRLVERYREEGLELVSVNVDTQREFVNEFLKELGPNGVPLYHMTSRDASHRFGVNKLPAVMVLDAEGKPLAPPQAGSEVDDTIARRLNKTVSEPQLSKKPSTESRR